MTALPIRMKYNHLLLTDGIPEIPHPYPAYEAETTDIWRGPIAYCHTRRANRTFRIDRLQLLDQPPG